MDYPLIDDITSHLVGSLDVWYGEGSHLDVIQPEFRSFRNCFILSYPLSTSSGTKKTILVKIRRRPDMNSLWQAIDADIHKNIAREYESLVSVYSDLAGIDHELEVIRPLAYLEKYHAIVMEEYPSITLRQLLIKHRNTRNLTESNELIDAAKKTGQWLSLFHHRIHQPIEKPYSSEDILSLVSNNALSLQTCTRGRVNAQSIMDGFKEKLENIRIDSMMFSPSPADMTCDNVLYSVDKKVCVIDIQTRAAPVYADLGLILAHPETFKIQILSAGTYLSQTLLGKYRAAILNGYFGSEVFDTSLVMIYGAVAILYKWRMYEELISKYRGVKYLLSLLVRNYVTHYFRTALIRYLTSVGIQEADNIPEPTKQAEPSAPISGKAT